MIVTGLSKRAEIIEQQRIMRQLERRFTKPLAREIFNTMIAASRAYNSPAKLAEIFANHNLKMDGLIQSVYALSAARFGTRIIGGDSIATDKFNRMTRHWIGKHTAKKVTEIAGTTKDQALSVIRQSLDQSIADGLNEEDAADVIRINMQSKGAQLSSYRSRVIARTETSFASQAANHNAGIATGLSLKKQWAANTDGRERDTHKHADGQTKNIHEFFMVGKSRLMHPSDSSGQAEDVINCRCVELLITY